MRVSRSFAFLAFGSAPLAAALFASACGSRTGLPIDDAVTNDDGGPHRHPVDATIDAPDALPLIDARPNPDGPVILPACADAGSTLIYAVTSSDELLAFDPPTATFRVIGTLACADPLGEHPFSMAVDRKGIAYVVYSSGGSDKGRLYRVSTANASCAPTSFVSGQNGFTSFGMGFVSDDVGGGETLYVADVGGNLGSIDVKTFILSYVGPLGLPSAELTGTGDGRLFGFYNKASASPGSVGSAVAQIDKHTGATIAETPLPTVVQGSGWAFGFWGGDFYLFTASNGPGSTVTRFRPSDGTVVDVATYAGVITGAGVSTCAPSQ